MLQLAENITKLARRASTRISFAYSGKMGLRIILDELVRPSVELHELLIEAEDCFFELKNRGLRDVKRWFELKVVLAQLRFY